MTPSVECLHLIIKRDINFASIRKFWRIIRLKDRGIEHNFSKDKINRNDNILVYKAEYNRITTYGGIIFSLIAIMGCVYLKVMSFNKEYSDPFDTTNNISFKYGFYPVFLVCVIIIIICKRYVLRIYYNESQNKFTLSMFNWFWPLSTRTISCKAGDAVEIESTTHRILGNCRINQNKLFINEEHFKLPAYYNLLFGYSQPMPRKQLPIHSNNQRIH